MNRVLLLLLRILRPLSQWLLGMLHKLEMLTMTVIRKMRGASKHIEVVISGSSRASSTSARVRNRQRLPEESQDVKLINDYIKALPSAEPWLRNNAEARASVERGLEQAARREVHYLGSFAKFADLEIDD